MRRFIAVAALSFIFATPQQQIPRAGESIDVSLVNVDVFVTDKKGNRITGLTADDFEIRENGRVQPITNFAEYSSSLSNERVSVEGGAKPATAAPPAKRTIIVFIERFTLANFHTEPMFDAIRSTLGEIVRPGDAAAVIFWDQGTPFTLQTFTDDLDLLNEAIDFVEAETTGVAGSLEEHLYRRDLVDRAYYDSLPPEKLPQGEEDVRAGEAFNFRASSEFELFKFKRKAQELDAIMRSLSGVDGRKILLFATGDFGLHAGARKFPDGRVPGAMRPFLNIEKYRAMIARTANEHGITVYPIYPVGLEWTAPNAMESVRDIYAMQTEGDAARFSRDNYVLLNQTVALDDLADETGGLTAAGSVEIAALLPRIVDDLDSYYSLAYRTPSTGTTKARDIRVRAKNREYVVRSRREYVEKTDVTRMQDRVIAHLYHGDEEGTIPLALELGEVRRASRTRFSVPVKVRIPVSALTTIGASGTFSLFVAMGGEIGIMSDVQHRTQAFEVKSDVPDGAYFTHEFSLEFNGATGTISIGVMDETTKTYGLARAELPAV